VVVESDAFTVRQWLKFGPNGDVIPAGESHLTFDEARSNLVSNGWSPTDAAAWTPGDAISFQVGSDHGYLTHARMVAQSTPPSLTDLDQLATSGFAPVWADYPFIWQNGAPDLHDQSGNGRDLLLPSGGTLYQGVAGPAL
jgi:hypothetical protein